MLLINTLLRYPFLLGWQVLSDLYLWLFNRRIERGPAANREALVKILKQAQATRFGEQYAVREILAADDPVAAFRARVPLRSYAEHADDIRAIADGSRDVLFQGLPTMFVATSGTTSDPKLLPTTRAQQLRTLAHIALLAPAVRRQAAPKLRMNQRGINLMLASGAGNTLPGGFALGMSSGGGIRKMLRAAPFTWTSPAAVFELENHKTALYLHALFGLLDEDAGCIEAVFGTHIVSWAGLLLEQRAQLVADIAAGRICADLDIPADLRERIERQLHAHPERARAVEREFAAGDQGILARLWPRLQVLSTVVSGPFAVSLPRLRHLAGDRVQICGTCFGATEGMVGVNLWPEQHERYVISAGTAFYEFVPLAAVNEAAPAAVDLEDVRIGEAYELVVTTFAGLYRYRLGDIVRVVAKAGGTPVFEFDHRLGDVLDLVGEKTSSRHTKEAILNAANAMLGSSQAIHSYTMAADSATDPYRYRVYLELATDVDPSNIDVGALAARFDQELRVLNLSYQTIGRKTGRLGLPDVVLVNRGSFVKLEERQYREGAGVSRNQVKVPGVLRNPAHIALLENQALE